MAHFSLFWIQIYLFLFCFLIYFFFRKCFVSSCVCLPQTKIQNKKTKIYSLPIHHTVLSTKNKYLIRTKTIKFKIQKIQMKSTITNYKQLSNTCCTSNHWSHRSTKSRPYHFGINWIGFWLLPFRKFQGTKLNCLCDFVFSFSFCSSKFPYCSIITKWIATHTHN